MTTNGYPDWNINGLIPIGNGVADDYGTLWFIDGAVGGWDSPDMRMTMLPHLGTGPSSSGETAGDLHYRGRSLTMHLCGAATSEANRESSMLLLARALDLTLANGSIGQFHVNEVVPKFCYIQRAGNTGQGKLTATPSGLTQLAAATPAWASLSAVEALVGAQLYPIDAQLEMFAQDPIKYAQSDTVVAFNTSTGHGSITPQGNTITDNMLLECHYSAPPTGPIVMTFGGQTMQLLVPTVPSGGPTLNPIPAHFFVDFYSKQIYDNSGTPVNYFYLRDLQTPWLTMPAADLPTPAAHTFSVSPVPNTAASLTYYDGWI